MSKISVITTSGRCDQFTDVDMDSSKFDVFDLLALEHSPNTPSES